MRDPAALSEAQWDQVAACFEAALDLPTDAHAGYVAAQLSTDPRAQREVLEMLAASTPQRQLGIEPRLLASEPGEQLLADGTRLGAWRLLGLIGQGGMSDVYRAERVDGGFEQPVAVKVLRAGADRRETVRRFEAERRILAQLAHPHIVSIIDGGDTADGRPYLVMPQVDGLPITEHCDRQQLGLEDRLRLFIDVADAVQFAHTRLIVHRDIKPSNILVTATGTVQLLDFGIAKLLAPERSEATTDPASPPDLSMTQSLLRLWTPLHAAPEQVLGAPITTSTDVYGLGVLLYQLLTGSLPHVAGGRSMRELEQDILSVDPKAPSMRARHRAWARQLRGDLDRIVLMALRKEPDRRYASAGQFREDIDRYLRGLPVLAERDRFGYRARKFLGRHRVAVTAGVLVAAMLASVTVNTMRQSRLLAHERDVAQEERASAESVASMLTALLARANPLLVPGGDTLRVEQLVAVAEAQVDSLDSTPRLQARMRRVLGTTYLARGRPDLARAQLQRAYDQLRALPDADSAEVARVYFELGRAIEGFEGRAKALPLYYSALERLRRVLPDTARDVAIAARQVAERTDDPAEQRRVLEQQTAAADLAQVTDTIERAGRLHALAAQRLEEGSIIEATALFEEVLRLVDLKLPPEHPDRTTVAGNLGQARRAGGELELAVTMTRARIAARERERPVNPLLLADAIESYAVAQAERGNLEEAERSQRDALARWRSAQAPTHSRIALALRNLGLIVSSRGRWLEALAYQDSALVIVRGATGSEADLLVNRDVRAELLLRADRAADAARELAAIAPPIAARWPVGHANRTAHDVRYGLVALALGQADSALAHFALAEQGMAERVPAAYPLRIAAACGRAVSLVRLGRRDESRAELASACERYRRYGVHVPALVQWADALTGSDRRD